MTVITLDPWRPYHLRLIFSATLCSRIISHIVDFKEKLNSLKRLDEAVGAIPKGKRPKAFLVAGIAAIANEGLKCIDAIIMDSDTLLFREEDDFRTFFEKYQNNSAKNIRRERYTLKKMQEDIDKMEEQHSEIKDKLKKHSKKKKEKVPIGKFEDKKKKMEAAVKEEEKRVADLENHKKFLEDRYKEFLRHFSAVLRTMAQEQKVMTRETVANPWRTMQEFSLFGDRKLTWVIRTGAIKVNQLLRAEKEEKKHPEEIEKLLESYTKELEILERAVHNSDILLERFESGLNYCIKELHQKGANAGRLEGVHIKFMNTKERLFAIQRRLANEIKQ